MDNEEKSYTYGELLNYIDGICKKFQYNFEMNKLLKKIFPIIIDYYGNDYYKKIVRVFFNTPIIVNKKINRNTLNKLQNFFKQKDKIVITEKEDVKNEKSDPGAILGFEPIFDKNCNIVEEKRWIVVKDMKETKNEDVFLKYFDTTINVPFLIHEICHAIGSLNSVYQKKDNKLYYKTGMIEQLYSIEKKDNQYILKKVFSKYFALDKAINELDTREILSKLLKIPYDSIEFILKEIGNDNLIYSNNLITVAEELKSAIGKECLNKYRIDNDMNIKNEYNDQANKSVITINENYDKEPFDVMDFYTTKLYELNCRRSDYDNISFEKLQNYYVFHSVLPSFAYKNTKGMKEYTYENFVNLKNSLLSTKKIENKKR